MESEQLFVLKSRGMELVLAPGLGGSIARLDLLQEEDRTPVLRGADGVPPSILEAACFPLVPFVNRIRGGCFSFRGRSVRIQPNMKGDPSPLHGQGWKSSWESEHRKEDEVDLVCLHEPAEWPWRYEARQRFRLHAASLELELSCINLSDEPMPCGLGFHPYFHCSETTRLATGVSHAWTVDEDVLPVAKVPATGRFDLSDRQACRQDLDNGFSGWSGSARISDPSRSFDILLSSPDAGFFQLYSPPDAPVFVAEPVTHANAALNEPEEDWPELGLRILESGESMSLRARIAARERAS